MYDPAKEAEMKRRKIGKELSERNPEISKADRKKILDAEAPIVKK